MTPQEEEEFRRRLMRGTENPYANPEAMAALSKQLTGEERQVENQMRMAEQMRGQKTPQGRTVGPYDVYMGPNWGEAVGNAATILGGGLLGRSAAKRDRALDEERSNIALQKALYQKGEGDAATARDVNKAVIGEGARREAVATAAANRAEDIAHRDRTFEAGREDAEFRENMALRDDAFRTTKEQNRQAELAEAQRREDAQRIEDYERLLERDELSHEQAMELERLKQGLQDDPASMSGLSDAQQAAVRSLGSAGERKAATTMLNAIKSFDAVIDQAAALPEGSKFNSAWVDGTAEVLSRLPGGKVMSNAVKRAYSEDEMAVKGAIKAAFEQYKRSLTGANLTAIETALGADWDPGAEGITDQQALDRARRVQDFMGTHLETMGIPVERGGAATGPTDTQTAFPNAPEVGTTEGGFRYKGGDPADPNNWEKV